CLLGNKGVAGGWQAGAHSWLRLGGGVALLLLVGQISLGAWTSSNYAALACPDFPTCQGCWWPRTDFSTALTLWHGLGIDYEHGIHDSVARATIHWTHRLGAVVIAVVMARLSIWLWRTSHADHRWRRLALALLAAVTVQIGLGIAIVELHLPLSLAVAHNGGAALLLLVLVLINHAVWSARNNERIE